MSEKIIKRLNDLGQGKKDVPKIDPKVIQIRPGFNHRDFSSQRVKDHIEWLKSDIRENGVQEPLRVDWCDRIPWLVNGECRLIAILALIAEGLEIRVPVMQIDGDEPTILAASLRANGGLPPTPLEFGRAAERLTNFGWSASKIAEFVPPHLATGRNRETFVRNALELQQAPVAVKEQVREGVDGVEISPALAIHEIRRSKSEAPERIREAAAEAKAKGKSKALRPKTAGPVTIAKGKTEKALKVADELATMAVSESYSLDDLLRLARKYLGLRRI